MNKIELDGPVWLASDVHLGQHTTGTAEAFRDFLKLAASEASALLLPGDIFDAWIGDDVAVVAPPSKRVRPRFQFGWGVAIATFSWVEHSPQGWVHNCCQSRCS